MNARSQMNAVFRTEVTNFVPRGAVISAFQKRDVQARVAHPNSKWVKELTPRFDELTGLDRGWDGYDGLPVSFACAQFAANLLERLYVKTVPSPHLVPGSDGTVQIEWHRNQFDVEIEVLAPFQILATRYSHLTDKTEELVLSADFTDLMGWVDGLAMEHDILALGGAA